MRDFTGKVVVITGAADGIGKALAGAFAAAGARLVLADIDGPKLEAVGAELAGLGTEVIAVATDVSDRDQVTRLRDAALTRFGAVHVLCNNAAVQGPAGDPLWELPAGNVDAGEAPSFLARAITSFSSPSAIKSMSGNHPSHVPRTTFSRFLMLGAQLFASAWASPRSRQLCGSSGRIFVTPSNTWIARSTCPACWSRYPRIRSNGALSRLSSAMFERILTASASCFCPKK